MENPLNVFVEELRDTFALAFTVIAAIIILGIMGTAFGLTVLTNQMINSITWGFLLILAVPSTALVILIIWVVHKLQEISVPF